MTQELRAALCKVIYGDAVDPGELSKLDNSDTHVDGAQRAQRKRALLGAGLLTGAAIEGLAAGHTLAPLKAGIKAVAPAVSEASGAGKVKALKPLFSGSLKQVATGQAAPGLHTALQVGNFGVGVGAAKELLHPKKEKVGKALTADPRLLRLVEHRAHTEVRYGATVRKFPEDIRLRGNHQKAMLAHAGAQNVALAAGHPINDVMAASARGMSRFAPLGKALRVRLRPLNPDEIPKLPPSLRARRPAGSPMQKALKLPKKIPALTRTTGQPEFIEGVRQRQAFVLPTTRHGKRPVSAPSGGRHRAEMATRELTGTGKVVLAGAGGGVLVEDARRRRAYGPMTKSVNLDMIAKADDERMQIFGWASVSELNGEVVVDRQGDVMPIDEVEKAAYDFVLNARVGGDQHRRIRKADDAPLQTSTLIESMVFTPEKIEKMGLPADFPRGWWTGWQLHDRENWNLIKSGKRTGFSVHGTGKREPISKGGKRLVPISKGERLDRLKHRADSALHPPPVETYPVRSSAVARMGYRPQTRQLAVEMHSRPGKPYTYKAGMSEAADAMGAPSIGRHYATEIRGQLPRKEQVNVVDRVRLFARPPEKKVSKSTAENRRRRARQIEVGGQVTAGTVGSAFGAAKLRDSYRESYSGAFERHVKNLNARGTSRAASAAKLLEHGKPGFAPLVAAVTAGGIAGGAHRYQQLSGLREQRHHRRFL